MHAYIHTKYSTPNFVTPSLLFISNYGFLMMTHNYKYFRQARTQNNKNNAEIQLYKYCLRTQADVIQNVQQRDLNYTYTYNCI